MIKHSCLLAGFLDLQVERIAKVAFESAQKRKGKLCSVEKSNVLEVSQLWKEVVTRVGKDYPDVELSHMYASIQVLMHNSSATNFITLTLAISSICMDVVHFRMPCTGRQFLPAGIISAIPRRLDTL